MNKISYEKPTTELLVVRFEENILIAASAYGTAGYAGGYAVINDIDDDF